MNNSNACANNLAQSNPIAQLVERANQQSFNWVPFVHFVVEQADPCDIERNLLELYFRISEVIADDNVSGIDSAQLWYLSQMIKIAKALHSSETPQIVLNTKVEEPSVVEKIVYASDPRDMELISIKNQTIEVQKQLISELKDQIDRLKQKLETECGARTAQYS